jgi:hypothetical protein
VGGPSAVHLGDMDQTEKSERRWREVCRLAAESLCWRGKAESDYCNSAANGGRGKERTSGRRFHGRDFESERTLAASEGDAEGEGRGVELENWARSGERDAHWQRRLISRSHLMDAPLGSFGAQPCTYRWQTPDPSQIIIDGAVLGQRHRLCLAAVKLPPPWPGPMNAEQQRDAGERAGVSRQRCVLVVRKQSAESPLGRGAGEHARCCCGQPAMAPSVLARHPGPRGDPRAFWPTRMQKDDLRRRRTLREWMHCAHHALSRRTVPVTVVCPIHSRPRTASASSPRTQQPSSGQWSNERGRAAPMTSSFAIRDPPPTRAKRGPGHPCNACQSIPTASLKIL